MRNPWLYQRRGSLPCHISHSRPQSETNSSCSHSSLVCIYCPASSRTFKGLGFGQRGTR
ncbi:hypothetical protein WALSEDRAFT_60540 [Wallemia mellicola CBS 633.66]|nr:hypothetical protein WALSEDRAFT_60540 [Wallemia mellicola CBS 633.66]EIM21351.1 hypothetical protein WALSEDRAFT_60540 [Wallemia mellicola CBS 633.66]|eukprot:XP_006958699.1 hypothetical protein WALSEDRAFT_60540 [Wallemia mellicola CBS 633.66]